MCNTFCFFVNGCIRMFPSIYLKIIFWFTSYCSPFFTLATPLPTSSSFFLSFFSPLKLSSFPSFAHLKFYFFSGFLSPPILPFFQGKAICRFNRQQFYGLVLTLLLTGQALQPDVSSDKVAFRPCMESSQISTWLLLNDARSQTGSLLQTAS